MICHKCHIINSTPVPVRHIWVFWFGNVLFKFTFIMSLKSVHKAKNILYHICIVYMKLSFTVTIAKVGNMFLLCPWPLFAKRLDILLPNLVNPGNGEIACYNDGIALKFARPLVCALSELPVKYQSDWKSLNPNPVASILHEIWRQDVLLLNE